MESAYHLAYRWGGGFEPVFIQNAETFLREYLKDETSTIVVPAE